MAPGRSARPIDPAYATVSTPSQESACPFCPGNEAELLGVSWELPGPEPPGWRARAVPNRYPAFVDALPTSGAQADPEGTARGDSERHAPSTAYGAQEVLIETPRHDLDPSLMTMEQIGTFLAAYHTRYLVHQERDSASHTLLFRNRGRDAGSTRVHPHGQLVSIRRPVPEIERRERRMARFHQDQGVCMLCELDTLEPDAEARTVAKNAGYVAQVPWAPVTAFEVWIRPRGHQASFGEADAAQRLQLAEVLGTVLGRLRTRAGDPAYNAVWHTARWRERGSPHLHWFLVVRPRTTRTAGFELATGVDICPSDPSRNAELLR